MSGQTRDVISPAADPFAYLKRMATFVWEPVRSALLQQIESANPRFVHGRFKLAIECNVDASAASATTKDGMVAEATAPDKDGAVVCALLHMHGGYMTFVEFFREDGEPIITLPSSDDFTPPNQDHMPVDD
jgi:hypothetical protein